MDKAMKMGKTSATGGFHLFVGQLASTIMLAIGSIIVGIYIDQGQYGLYVIALVPVNTLLLFVDWGVGSALTKYCAHYRASQMEKELRKIIKAGLVFSTATGITLTLVSLSTANFVASSVFSNPETALLITLVSFTILSTAIYSASRSIFVGFERMKLATVTVIISATVQGLLSPLLVYLGFGALGAIIGFSVASFASGITSLALLYFTIFRQLPSESVNRERIFQILKPLLKYGIPLSISTIIAGVSLQVSQFVMASFVEEAMIGNYRIATNFAVFLTFFIYPIQTVLFPAFSKLNPEKDRHLLKTIFASSVKYSSLFLVPAIMALIVLCTPLISTIYGNKWPSAPSFLAFSIVANLLVVLGNLSANRLLYATGETKLLMKLAAITLFIQVPLAFLLIPSLGIIGVIIGGIVSGFPSVAISIYWAWKHYEIKADLKNSAKILLASTISAILTYLTLNIFVMPAWMMLAAGALIFLFAYLLSIPLFGAINRMDIDNLRVMFSELGPISKLLEIPIYIIELPLNFKDRFSSVRN
jgi:O-antigen/teichoic acid export membrane protein